MRHIQIPIKVIATTVNADEKLWAALDDPDEWANFSSPTSNSGELHSRLAVEGMHCAACGATVERALKNVKGVSDVQVNASTGRASIIWSTDATKPSIWLSAVSAAGYRAIPAMEFTRQDNQRKAQRVMLWRWLVAGFCMMQVMMYAYPAYVARPGEMTPDVAHLMHWASWVLTLPVMLFSSTPFFENAWRDIKLRQISMDMPVAIGIIVTFIVSSAVTFDPSGWWGKEVYFDSLTMFVFFLLTGRWLESRLRVKTANSLDALMRRLPESTERLKQDGSFERVAVRRLNVGDVIRVLAGESFPADGIIISGNTQADEALLTGESTPVIKDTNAVVIAGSHNLSAPITMRITQVGKATRFAQIVALMEKTATEKPRLALLADKIAKPFLIGVLIAAVLAATYWWSTSPSHALMVAVAVLIVTCPCALSLATPAAMLATAGMLARNGILVRNLQSLETLAKIDTVIFDKTGTLTQDYIRVRSTSVREGFDADKALQIAFSMAKQSLHPVSRALVAAGESLGVEEAISHIEEIAGRGLSAQWHNRKLKLGSATFCEIKEKCAPHMQVHLADDDGWLATFDLDEALREDAKQTLQTLAKDSIQIEMLSGDRDEAAQNIAAQLDIARARGNCSPQEKLAHLQSLRTEGKMVAMVGDGLNDGPVLTGADVSIAMGHAVPIAQAQSDFIILGKLSSLPLLMHQARRTMRVVKQNLAWAAIYNAICVPLAMLGMLPAWLAGLGMAASSLLVVLNALRLTRIKLTHSPAP